MTTPQKTHRTYLDHAADARIRLAQAETEQKRAELREFIADMERMHERYEKGTK